MDSASIDKPAHEVVVPTTPSSSARTDDPSSSSTANPAIASSSAAKTAPASDDPNAAAKSKIKTKASKKKKKKPAKEVSSDDSSSSTDDSESDTSSSSDDGDAKKSRKSKSKKKKQSSSRKHRSSRSKKSRKRRSDSSDSDLDDTDSDSEESDVSDRPKKRKSRRNTRRRSTVTGADPDEDDEADAADASAPGPLKQIQLQLAALTSASRSRALGGRRRDEGADGPSRSKKPESKSNKKRNSVKRGSTLEFKRVDQLWDKHLHDFRLKESAEIQEDQFDEFVFTVRRCFNWENKYRSTLVDIKSKTLRDALQAVMTDVKGVSLVEEQPSVDPNMLFLYLEELRTYSKTILKAKVKAEKKKKTVKRLKTMRAECKLLVKYLDEDYADTKKTLYPMLEAGNITFDLLWALFKPSTIAYTPTYGANEHPRCFKVDVASRESSFTRGDWYCIEGRYLEYDGKTYGLGDFEVDVPSFKGARKITSLATYPLMYHADAENLKTTLIERGKRFVSFEGMNYRFHKGLAFMKKRKQVAKVNINGRIMIDPAIFRRINPNYPISNIKPKDEGEDCCGDDSNEESDCSSCESESESGAGNDAHDASEETKTKVIIDENDELQIVQVPIDADGNEIKPEKLDALPEEVEGKAKREFTEEELLIASPVVLGFAFSEKLWLEFSLSGVRDIEWNEGAFESLVLPDNQKDIVKALVESHKFHAAKTIDDVVQGKGKGLVAVLHGPPGTGKTLTAEGIAELLKCPLYMVSAGELGTDSRMLEGELQKILDIAHSWGAVLLLDEADVFLEKREVHDIHRNALVSIFLRLLEYFQGILFLTTNRVETFDDAFQSRIHVALRYGELTAKAKKAVWRMFLEKVRAMEGIESVEWTEEDYEVLSRKALNGRQIKNSVRTAQALAVNNTEKLSMEHIKRVLDVAESFEQDLKGGTGYKDAMRQYT